MRYIRYVILIWAIIQSSFLKAQQYPIDVQVFVTPPYQQSLRDYWASFEPKVQLHLLLKDLNSPMRNVALGFSLENVQGQPLAQTPNFLQPFQTQLTSGVRKTLSNIELKPLFAFENLQGISENFYNDLLPEGAYFMCFTAYDVATQMPLSAKARTLVQIRRYTPPLPTLPAKGEIISKKNQFQHLVFQWMLRDPAPFTQYEFTLKEVWDNSLSPDEAFISGRLVYQGKVPSNTILYGTDKPILLENKRYVWKVRAFTQNPNNPNQRQSFFHNEGHSETFYFDYVSHCEAPKFLTAITKDNTVNIRWSGEPPRASISNVDGGRNLYKILYREKGKNWKSQMSNHPQATLIGLKRGRNYVYKVGVACGLGQIQSVFSEQTYLYSTEQEFVTPHKQNDSTSVQCGVKPEIRIKNREPLQEVLGVNETFTAGDFPVTVLRATGSNGVFSGEGYVQVPYLLDTKIKVKFDGIKINSERQLFEGKLVTSYDKTEKNLQFVQEGIGEVFGDAGVKTNKIDFEIAEIKKDENGRITVIGKPDEKTGIAPQITLPVGSDYQLSDASGKTWTLDEKGEVTSVGEKADTKLAQNQGKNNLPKGQSKPENFEVQWDFSQSAFAFDASGEIPYKALVKGKNDVFQVVIKQKDSLRYSFHFQTDKGLKVESKKEKEGVFEISRKGLFDFGDEELWVVAQNTKTEKEEVIGKCMLVHLSEKEVNVTLVPTTENLQIGIDAIQRIYAKVGVKLHISTDEIFPVKETIDTKNAFGDLSTYSPEQQAIIAWYKSERATKPDTYYVFVGKQEGSQVGYMRLGGQFGFAFLSSEAKNLARTIAHELGHGIFRLEHPFKKDETKKGTFRTLMDYTQETTFAHTDWKQINDPKLKIYAFQGQSEGEFSYTQLTPEWQPFKFSGSSTYVSGRVKSPNGAVHGIAVCKNKDCSETINYFWTNEGNKKGYYAKGISEPLAINYLNQSEKNGNPAVVLFWNYGKCGYNKTYTTTWNYIKDKKGIDIHQITDNNMVVYRETIPCIDGLGNTTKLDDICKGKDIAQTNKEYNKILEVVNSDDSDLIVETINNVNVCSLKLLKYEEIEKLFGTLADDREIKENKEKAIVRLVASIKSENFKSFFTLLESNNNALIKNLMNKLHDTHFLYGENNYTSFVSLLLKMYKHNPNSWLYYVKDEDYFVDKIILANPIDKVKSFKQLLKGEAKRYYNTYTIDENKNIIIEENECSILPPIGGTDKGTFSACVPKVINTVKVSPLSPVLVETSKELPVIKLALELDDSDNKNTLIVPAIFLDYVQEKVKENTFEKTAITTLDALTIVTGTGVVLSGASKAKRIWALMEIVGATGNIAVNTANVSSDVQKVVDTYNLAMGVIGIKNLGQGGYKFLKNLPNETRELLQKNRSLRDILKKHYIKWKEKVSQLDDNISYDDKKNIYNQSKSFDLLGVADKVSEIKKAKYPLEDFIGFVGWNFTKEQKNKFEMAKSFYSKYNSNFNVNELRGIDFDNVVEIITKNKYNIMYQMVKLDDAGNPRFGSYFFESATEDVSKLGIGDLNRIIEDGRVKVKIVLSESVDFLKSKTTDIEDWTGSGEIFSGGGNQFYSPVAREKIESFEIIK
ncbi:fibronectin type III domain-containing protein [Capnocytophaga canimorsus]|uniref:fibronectin type III domain-containing protein n=1 Tax=Capnocytophaga canimorsus TaxID=28188 RepID=UPI0037CE7785